MMQTINVLQTILGSNSNVNGTIFQILGRMNLLHGIRYLNWWVGSGRMTTTDTGYYFDEVTNQTNNGNVGQKDSASVDLLHCSSSRCSRLWCREPGRPRWLAYLSVDVVSSKLEEKVYKSILRCSPIYPMKIYNLDF